MPILTMCIIRKFLFLCLVFFFRELFIAYAVLLVSEIETKETIMTITTVITKSYIMTVFEIETIDTLVTFFWIDNIKTSFTFKRKNSIECILTIENTVWISIMFAPHNTMREITITTKPTIIAEFAILIIESWIMWQRTSPEEYFRLGEKWLIKIHLCWRGKCRCIPFVFVPYRIGAIWTKYRDDIAPCFITSTFMERPMRPESTEMSDTKIGEKGWLWKTKILPEFSFKFWTTEWLTCEGTNGHRESIWESL